MVQDFWGKKRLISKILICVIVLLLVPLGVISNLTFRHLRTIKDASLLEARSALISSQVSYLQNHLAQKAEKISTEFSNIKGEVQLLSSLTESILEDPSGFLRRNGSSYRLDEEGDYVNPADDGNSSLLVPRSSPSFDTLISVMEDYDSGGANFFVPTYNSSLDSLIGATENLDIYFKPLAELEPRIVLGWFIHKDGISRAYPWTDFKRLPRHQGLTSWPFYYLADPDHNPSGREVFTPVYTDPLSRDCMISCLSPVFVDGEHMATVGVDITVQTLLQEISQVRLTEGSSSLLLSDEEILAASENLPLAALGLDPDRPPHEQNIALAGLSEVGKAVIGPKERKMGVKLIEVGDFKAFLGHAVVEPLGWRLFLLAPEADLAGPANEKAQEIFAEAERIRSNFLQILIVAMIAVGSLGYVVIAHQSRGLRTLLGGIHEFGRGNLSHRVREEGNEFGQLAQALNTMAESLLEKNEELQRAYAEVEQGRKFTAVGRLAAGVAHEVNNPLATISTYTQLLLRSDLPAEASERLQKVMGEIDRIQEKLRNLLDLSRSQDLVKTRVNPNALVLDVVEMACHEARLQGVELSLFLDENPREFFIDQSGLKQVLWNLLGNALAAQGQGGTVRVRTRFVSAGESTSSLLLEVEDEGPGISEEVLPHIFDPFFTTKEVGQGTGLGLAVVSTIVQGHSGKIEVQNLDTGGCRFRVLLPEGREG